METSKPINFWFSQQGINVHENELAAFADQVTGLAKKNSREPVQCRDSAIIFDVVTLHDLPELGLVTFMTLGLSDFLLGDFDTGFLRNELAITLQPEAGRKLARRLLTSVADVLLLRRQPCDPMEIFVLPHVDPSGVHALLADIGVWLPEEMHGFKSGVNTVVMELVPVKVSDRHHLSGGAEAFRAAVLEGKVDVLDISA